ncbi:MAG: hypothetical protein HY675_29450, partial [Chloroflexi bacterium]|nr:hypothetical protein [Chloroflexota bacterium]
AEDTAQFSFAGMFQSFLNVRGDDDLVRQIKACWASLFGARVLFYRIKQGLLGEQFIAVIVQKMVNADRSGVLFTIDPATNNPKVLVIEAAWGLGEVVVGGQVTPDRYEVDKESLALVAKQIGRKDFMLVRDEATGDNVRVDLSADKASARVLSEPKVRALSELGKRDEEHYSSPQDAEWAIERGKIYLVQTRPVTTLVEKARRLPQAAKAKVLLHGLGASPGSASGIVRVLSSPEEADKLKPGDVLVTVMTAPDWVPLMRRAAAIVTDAGGMTSHAAIVSRELGIPCVVGTRDATRVLKEGMPVTVNAREGTVVAGALPEAKPQPAVAAPSPPVAAPTLVTATKLYVNLGEPELAEQVAQQPVDGIGLLRAEFMILAALQGIHPRKLLEEKRGKEFVARMVEKLLCAPLFDECDKAVLQVIQAIIRECKRLGITSSICGQAPSVYPDYAEMLVRWGIDSISVNPDVIARNRRNIATAEQKLILGEARQRLET